MATLLLPAFLPLPSLFAPFAPSSLPARSPCRPLSLPMVRTPTATARTPDPLASSALGPPHVICVGEALFDLLTSDADAPTSDRTAWTPYPGGAPANLAAGLANLATSSALVGNVGADLGGDELLAVLRAAKVNVDGVLRLPGTATREVFVRRDARGERSFVGFSGDNATFADAKAIDVEKVPGVLFYAAKVLVAPTLTLAFAEGGASLVELVKMARMCKLQVVVDVNWRPVFWQSFATESEARNMILAFVRDEPGADFVKVSVEEVAFLFDEELASTALKAPSEVLRRIGGGCVGVIVTAGEEGAAYAFEGGTVPVEGYVEAVAPKGGVVDTTGAGDAFLAGFLSEMLRMGGASVLLDEKKAKEVAEFAAVVASFVVGGEGSIRPLPSRETVEKAMSMATT